MMKSIKLLAFVFLPFLLSAQLSVSVDALQDTIGFGDEVVFNYKINVPDGVEISKIDFSGLKKVNNAAYESDTTMFDEFMDIDIVDGGVFEITDDNLSISKSNDGKPIPRNGSVKVRISSIGAFLLPVPNLVNNLGQPQLPLQSKPLYVLPTGQVQQIHDNKPIFEEQVSWKDYLKYLYGILAAAALVLLGLYLNKKLGKKEEEEMVEEVVIKKPAHIIAIADLDVLKSKKLWQNDQEKEYHTELTRIMRQYVEDRYDVQALEMTTSQLSRSMATQSISGDVIKRFTEILQIADKVKFAKGITGPEINERFMSDAYDIVSDTKKIELNEPTE